MSALVLIASPQVKKKRRKRCEKSRDSSSRERLIAGDSSRVKTFAQARTDGPRTEREREEGLHFVKPLAEISGMLISV